MGNIRGDVNKMRYRPRNTLTIGFVGHCRIDDLSQVKESIENLPGFKLVFFKTTSGRIWLTVSDSE
jgi:hypothetical protein